MRGQSCGSQINPPPRHRHVSLVDSYLLGVLFGKKFVDCGNARPGDDALDRDAGLLLELFAEELQQLKLLIVTGRPVGVPTLYVVRCPSLSSQPFTAHHRPEARPSATSHHTSVAQHT